MFLLGPIFPRLPAARGFFCPISLTSYHLMRRWTTRALNWHQVENLIFVNRSLFIFNMNIFQTWATYVMTKTIHKPVSIFKRLLWMTSLFVLLAPEPGVGVGDLDGQLSCPLHDQLPVLGGDVVGDLSTVSPTGSKGQEAIRHRQAVKLFNI